MIRGKKVLLRPVRDEFECRQWIDEHNDLSQRAALDHVELISAPSVLRRYRETGLWTSERGTLLVATPDNQAVGLLSFHKTSEFECEIGYRIFRAENRGKGFMREALPLFSSFLFTAIPNITRLKIMVADDNIPSRRLAEVSGYVQEGVIRQGYSYRGKICDWVIYGLLRGECPLLEQTPAS